MNVCLFVCSFVRLFVYVFVRLLGCFGLLVCLRSCLFVCSCSHLFVCLCMFVRVSVFTCGFGCVRGCVFVRVG